MASLYNRATPSQYRILRAVEGAVKNASDAHPSYKIPENFARSVAKRATGTLTAQWQDVLAARFDGRSEKVGEDRVPSRSPRLRSCSNRSGRGSSDLLRRRSPLPALWKALACQIRPLRSQGNHEKAEAFIEVLKMISAMQRNLK